MNLDDLDRWELTQLEKQRKALSRTASLLDLEDMAAEVRCSEVTTYYIDENGRRIDDSKADDDTEG